MAQEPDSLVLVHLREMRGQLNGITMQLQGIATKLKEHDRRFDELHLLANHALGLGMINQHRSHNLEERRDLTEAWQMRADERFDQLERRLAAVEEKPQT